MDDASRCLAKAERFADRAGRLDAADFELVIHAGYYAMYHAVRAALIAAEGGATTNHGRLPNMFAEHVERQVTPAGEQHARAFKRTYDLRIIADYGIADEDLSEDARRLQDRLPEFLAFCRSIVAQQGKR